MTPCFTDRGQFEVLKGAFHGALWTLAVICGAYNYIAWRHRREPHLAVNVAAYVGVVLFESHHIASHARPKP